MLSEWFNQVILAGALLLFLLAEAAVIIASLGWPNGHASLGTRWIVQLLVNAFLTSIPFVAGIGGCNGVNRLRPKFNAEGEIVNFIWLWRQYLAGTVFAYVAIILLVTSLSEAFRPK